jgi:hypothetical protein
VNWLPEDEMENRIVVCNGSKTEFRHLVAPEKVLMSIATTAFG